MRNCNDNACDIISIFGEMEAKNVTGCVCVIDGERFLEFPSPKNEPLPSRGIKLIHKISDN